MNLSNSNIAIVILAAGASSRMGSPKQLLKWGNDNLLNHAINMAINTNTSEIIVVLGAYYQLVEKEIKGHDSVVILKNKEWQEGLGKSIACATEYVLKSKSNTDGLLITLADQPFINSRYLNEMIKCFKPDKKQIIATAYDKGKKGVPVVFDRVYYERLIELSNDNGARELLLANQSLVKTLKPPVKNVDLDSKEDYEILHKANFKIK